LAIAYLDKLETKNIDSGIINLIPQEVARKYKMAAFSRDGNIVKVAMVDPRDANALNALRFIAEKEKIDIDVYLVAEDLFF